MRARTDLWEPWAGNRPGPPGQGIELSSPGAFGFRPWIDRKNALLGVFVVEIKDLKKKRALAGAESIQDQVREVVGKSEASH